MVAGVGRVGQVAVTGSMTMGSLRGCDGFQSYVPGTLAGCDGLQSHVPGTLAGLSVGLVKEDLGSRRPAERAMTAVIQNAYVQDISTRGRRLVKAAGLEGIPGSQVSCLCEEVEISGAPFS